MSQITDVLQGKEENYIMPFLWLHHENIETIIDNIAKIQESGIQAFCLESRPHPDFVGPKWWSDLDAILSEAKKRNMKVWILDDSHFPTGYANGKIKYDHPELRKLYLSIKQLDFCGPQADSNILLNYVGPNARAALMDPNYQNQDHLLKVLVAKKTNDNEIDINTMTDVTNQVEDNILHWNIPDGNWRVFALVETYDGGEKETENYLNPLDPKATQILVNEVYESHYQHYQKYFGNVIAGFFSDEPRFGNQHGSFSLIGQTEMVLPWRKGMLEQYFADDYQLLPLLSNVSAGGIEKQIRLKYMDIVSKLYSQNFSVLLGNWCHSHGVEYIGHVIEDNGAHTRLGYGAGHYFRALAGQDMAGIDVVLNQIMPGMDQGYFKSMTASGWNGEFFHYGLGKLGSALGHLDPKKKGRVMTELFGAYGWGEGLPLMKFLADYMFSRGVNYFVPHAFNPNKFPDPDCPPHFYANGREPENRAYSKLFNYMNRMAHIFSKGTYLGHQAILYHVEAEWMDGPTMPFERPMKVLMQHQIESEVVPLDYLKKSDIRDGEFEINHEIFKSLIIPKTKTLPRQILTLLKNLSDHQIKIIFIDELPQYDEYQHPIATTLAELGSVVSLDSLFMVVPDTADKIFVSTFEPHLRSYSYQVDEQVYTMFANENVAKNIDTQVSLNQSKFVYLYDGMNNVLTQVSQDTTQQFALSLAAGESVVVITRDTPLTNDHLAVNNQKLDQHKNLNNWQLSFTTAKEYPHFNEKQSLKQLMNVNELPGKETFSGNMQYTTTVQFDQVPNNISLDLGNVGEIAELHVNDKLVDYRIAKPFSFTDIEPYFKSGQNEIEVIVTNNLGIQQQDYLSQFIALKPAGLLGPVYLNYSKE